jgi:hypothetical protein
MKYFARFLRIAAVAVGSVALITAARAEIGSAVVRAVKGTADFSQAGGWKSLRVGTILKPGAIVRTGLESQVDLFLDHNGPVVRITESTELALNKLNFDVTGSDVVIDTELDLRSGRILGYVKRTSEASRYDVRTPQGVAAIKGTEYDISAIGVVKIVEGRVVFAYQNAQGQTVTQVVNTGEVFMVTDGRVRPIDQAELDGLLRIMNELKATVVGGQLLVIIPPQEPFVSAIVGSGSSGQGGSQPGD